MKLMYFKPNLRIDQLQDLKHEILRSYDVKTILLDVDNTLVGQGDDHLPFANLEWLNAIKDEFKLALISNNPSPKTKALGRQLGIDVLNLAMKPFPFRFKFWLKKHHFEPKFMMIGDQIFTDILFAKNINAISVLVKPISKNDHLSTKVLRKLENIILNDK